MDQNHRQTDDALITRIASDIEAACGKAYQRGWDDAIAWVVGNAKKARNQQDTPPAKDSVEDGSGDTDEESDAGEFKPGSLPEKSYKHVKANPGKSILEVVEALAPTGSGINPESVRTAIKRLRRDKHIELKEDGKLY